MPQIDHVLIQGRGVNISKSPQAALTSITHPARNVTACFPNVCCTFTLLLMLSFFSFLSED